MTACAKKGYIFKQRDAAKSITPCIDLRGSTDNANNTLTFDKSYNLKDWRYATQEEIDLYELNGKPCSIKEIVENIKPSVENFDYLIEIFNNLNIK